MRHERHLLAAKVYPVLEKLCKSHGAEFQAVDLRWGVSEEAQLDQRTMYICLTEIAKCQKLSPKPNFLVLLGDRYGWQPIPEVIPDAEMVQLMPQFSAEEAALVHRWYKKDEHALPPQWLLQAREPDSPEKDFAVWQAIAEQLQVILRRVATELGWKTGGLERKARARYFDSATHQEILHGALSTPPEVADVNEHVMVCRRTISGLPLNASASDFLDLVKGEPDCEAHRRLTQVAAELGARLSTENHLYYGADWVAPTGGSSKGDIHLRDEDAWVEQVTRFYSRVILFQLEERIQTKLSRKQREIAFQLKTRERLTKHFVGRQGELAAIESYLAGDSTQTFVLLGQSGTGKSSILAEAMARAEVVYGAENVLPLFLGTSAVTSSIVSLLNFLIEVLAQRQDKTPGDFLKGGEDASVFNRGDSVMRLFQRVIASADDAETAPKPFVIFLDSLDQLSSSENAWWIHYWLPEQLADGIKLVCSALPELDGNSFLERSKQVGAETSVLEKLPAMDAEVILDKWLANESRTLSPAHREKVLASFNATGLPIHLRVLFELAHPVPSYKSAVTLSETVDGAIGEWMDRIERQRAPVFVKRAVGLLLSGRYEGLTETEVVKTLSPRGARVERMQDAAFDLEYWEHFIQNAHPAHREEVARAGILPASVWTGFFIDLSPWMVERDAAGALVKTFFHRQIREALRRRYLATRGEEIRAHSVLANFFEEEPLYANTEETEPNLRKVVEQAYQQTGSLQFKDVVDKTLGNYGFLKATLEADKLEQYFDDVAKVFIKYDEGEWKTNSWQNAEQYQFDGDKLEAYESFSGRWKRLKEDPSSIYQQALCEPDTNVVCMAAKVWADERRAQGEPVPEVITWVNKSQDENPLKRVISHGDEIIVSVFSIKSDTELLVVTATKVRRLNARSFSVLAEWTAGFKISYVKWFEDYGKLGLGGPRGEVCLLRIQEMNEFQSGSYHPYQVLDILNYDNKVCHLILEGGGFEKVWLENDCAPEVICGPWKAQTFVLSLDDSRNILVGYDSGLIEYKSVNGLATIAVLRGHTKPVKGALMLGDSRTLSWSEDCTLRIWDLESAQEIHKLEGHTETVYGALLFGNSRLLSWSYDRTLIIWDLESGKVLQKLEGHTGGVHALLFADYRALSWSYDGTLIIWDLESGHAIHKLEGHTESVYGALLLVDCRALSWSGDCTLRIWDLESGHAVHKLEGHTESVYGALLLADCRALSWSGDCTLRIWDLESGTEIRKLEGHTKCVTGALPFGDGKTLSWSDDETLRTWDLETGNPLHTLEGHKKAVSGALMLEDGKALSWSRDGTLRTWDLETGNQLHKLEVEAKSMAGAILVGEEMALSWGYDGVLRKWDLKSGQEINKVEVNASRVRGAVGLRDGKTLLWSGDGTLRIWDIASGRESRKFEGHTKSVNGAVLYGDGSALSWADDGTLRTWDLASGHETHRLEGHTKAVSGVLMLEDGKALSWSEDQTLRTWDLASGHETHKLEGHTKAVSGALMLEDGKVLSWSEDQTLRTWELETAKPLGIFFENFTDCIGETKFRAMSIGDGKILSRSFGVDGALVIWDLQSGKVLRKLEGHTIGIRGALLPRKGRLLSWSGDKTLRVWDVESPKASQAREAYPTNGLEAFPCGDRKVLKISPNGIGVWDLKTGTQIHKLQGHTKSVRGTRFLAKGKSLSWSDDGTLRIWDLESGTEIRKLEGHTKCVTGALPFGDGKTLSWSDDETLRTWDLETGNPLHTLEGHKKAVSGALMLEDGKALSWSRDGTLRIWDLESGTEIRKLEGHTKYVTGALHVGDGKALSWSYDGTLRTWDLKTGNQIHKLEGHTRWGKLVPSSMTSVGIRAVVIDEDRVISLSNDTTLRLWGLKTGEELKKFEGHKGGIDGLLSICKEKIMSWSSDGTLRIWNLETGKQLNILEGHAARVNGAILTAEGRAISFSDDNTLRIWDPNTGNMRKCIETPVPLRGLKMVDQNCVYGFISGRLQIFNLE